MVDSFTIAVASTDTTIEPKQRVSKSVATANNFQLLLLPRNLEKLMVSLLQSMVGERRLRKGEKIL
ncbi:MAG: hypothetical protein AB7P18_04545 [Candidatus Binatia bacterium]